MAEKKKVYNFGEKTKEYLPKLGKEVDVWLSPKYIYAKKKVIEMLESEKYKNVLDESDFWILMNATKTGKMAYTGLIISHDGCLKINDTLEEKLKYKPECMTLDKEGYNNSLVYTYNCPEQGIYEVGEVSKDNLKNMGYPYAMALKRCIDRVILKNSKIAYDGIYSDSEADEFVKRIEDTEEVAPTETKTTTKATTTKATTKTTTTKKAPTKKDIMIQEDQVKIIKSIYTAKELVPFMNHLGKKKLEELTLIEASSLIKRKQAQIETKKKASNVEENDDNYLE